MGRKEDVLEYCKKRKNASLQTAKDIIDALYPGKSH